MLKKKVELVYFTGCPLVERARAALRAAGAQSFSEHNQDQLAADHVYKRVSSPSIFIDGQLVVGERGKQQMCSIVDWAQVGANLVAKLGSAKA